MNAPENTPTERELAELVALADGSLPPARRAEVEARVERSPHLQAALAEQRRAVETLRAAAAAEQARSPLRARIEAERARRAPAARRRRFTLGGFAVGATAAAALVIALALPGGAGGPSVVEAAALAEGGSEQGAPRPDSAEPALLEKSSDGVPFPNWGPKLRWPASGVRSDEIDGRDAVTVFYESAKGARVGYTILSGDTLDPPDDASSTMRSGVEYRLLRSDGRVIVTWERDGHTCVLSGENVPEDLLLDLAAWRSDL